MLKDLTYHSYENFDRKYDESDEDLFNETAKENLSYIIYDLETYKEKLDIVYGAAILTSKLIVMKDLFTLKYTFDSVPNIMNLAAVFADYRTFKWMLDNTELPLTTQIFDEAVKYNRVCILDMLYSKNCPIDYEEVLFIVLHENDTQDSLKWLKTHVKETKKLKTNEMYSMLKMNLVF